MRKYERPADPAAADDEWNIYDDSSGEVGEDVTSGDQDVVSQKNCDWDTESSGKDGSEDQKKSPGKD